MRVRRWMAGAAALGVLVGGGTAASAARTPGPPERDGALAHDLSALDRSAAWTDVGRLDLRFPTYHPEGLALTADRIFLSSTQVLEPTVKYPAPVDGYDRTPGKGIGHLFVIDRRTVALIKDVILGHGIVYHPGGIDLDGTDLWVPVAQYRPNSSAEIDRVDVRTLRVERAFTVDDHIGGVVRDRSTGRLVGNNWGSRTFYEWSARGRELDSWHNPDDLVDLQDCQYVPAAKMVCGGVTNLPQSPTAGGPAATYELGGIVLVDLRTRQIRNEVPFQKWSTAGHVMTRNPVKFAADGDRLTMWAAPDNGDEGAGTQLIAWQARVPS